MTRSPHRLRRPTILRAIAAMAVVGMSSFSSLGQIVPERVYYGVDRPMTMRVSVPLGDRAEEEASRSSPKVEIQLLEPGTARVLQRAAVVVVGGEASRTAGSVDLNQLFPDLNRSALDASRGPEEKQAPRLRGRTVYAQLVVEDRKVGPPVVLQAMMTPAYAPRLDRSGAPMFPAEKDRSPVFSGYRAYTHQNVELETSNGHIIIELRPESAPNTCWRFRELVAGGLYLDVPVHRIASLAGKAQADIVQTGDPNGTGQGGIGEQFDLEPSDLPQDFGVVSMARFSDPNSASSQFMIGLNREGTAYLDKRYTSFGVVIAGADVLRAIAATPVGADNRPKGEPPRIRSAKLVEAAPYGTGPGPSPDPARKQGR